MAFRVIVRGPDSPAERPAVSPRRLSRRGGYEDLTETDEPHLIPLAAACQRLRGLACTRVAAALDTDHVDQQRGEQGGSPAPVARAFQELGAWADDALSSPPLEWENESAAGGFEPRS
jgi:hypothetical protein